MGPVSMGQGHPQSGLVGKTGPSPLPWQPPWERKLLKVRWSGAGEAGRKRKRGDQAKLAPRRGSHPLPHRPPGKHKQLKALCRVLRVTRPLGAATICGPPSPG